MVLFLGANIKAGLREELLEVFPGTDAGGEKCFFERLLVFLGDGLGVKARENLPRLVLLFGAQARAAFARTSRDPRIDST